MQFKSPIQLVSNETLIHKTFLDTIGRTTLKLTAINVVDEARDQDVIVTYDYTGLAGLRKPLTIFAGVLCVYLGAWAVGRLDVSIKK